MRRSTAKTTEKRLTIDVEEEPENIEPLNTELPTEQVDEKRASSVRKSNEEVAERPKTPVWKRFRWKAWAMRKGLIKVNEMSTFANVCAPKAKTRISEEWPDASETVEDSIRMSMEFEEEVMEEEEEEETEADSDFLGGCYGTGEEDKSRSISGVEDIRSSLGDDIASSYKKSVGGSAVLSKNKRSTAASEIKSQRKTLQSLGNSDAKGFLRGSQTIEVIEDEVTHNDHPYEEDHDNSEEEQQTQTDEVKKSFKQSQTSSKSKSVDSGHWFLCAANADSDNIRKFCSLDPDASGSCYILRREPTVFTPLLDPIFEEIHSDLPKYPEFIHSYKQTTSTKSLSINIERFVSYSVTDYHLNEEEGIDSGFYLFSDSWIDQELSITVDILSGEFLQGCKKARSNTSFVSNPKSESIPGAPPPTPNSDISEHRDSNSAESTHAPSEQIPEEPQTIEDSNNVLHLVIEHWNWKKDNCRGKTLISTTIDDYWNALIRLPAGRNTFRIWLLVENKPDDNVSTEHNELDEKVEEETRSTKKQSIKGSTFSFIVKFVSLAPVYLGSRTEVQNYMTNEPIILLKQAEILANSLWELFSSFTMNSNTYPTILDQLRRSYCPVCPEPRMINKYASGLHDSLERLFTSLIARLNYGSLDRMLIITLRVLFINPMIGRNLAPPLYQDPASFRKKKTLRISLDKNDERKSRISEMEHSKDRKSRLSSVDKSGDRKSRFSSVDKSPDRKSRLSSVEKSGDRKSRVSSVEKSEDRKSRISTVEKSDDKTGRISTVEKSDDKKGRISTMEKSDDRKSRNSTVEESNDRKSRISAVEESDVRKSRNSSVDKSGDRKSRVSAVEKSVERKSRISGVERSNAQTNLVRKSKDTETNRNSMEGSNNKKRRSSSMRMRKKTRKTEAVDSRKLAAVIVIQKYYRGWRVRRLFHMRHESHKHFRILQYNVWRISILLANEKECVFSKSKPRGSCGEELEPENLVDDDIPSPQTTLPNPPRWSYNLLKNLLELHPGLNHINPYANYTANHIKIQEFEGELSRSKKEFMKCPFFKSVLLVPPGSKSCFCEIDLQVYPPIGIYMKIKNNDTKKPLPLANNRLFIGELPINEKGYSVQAYRWAIPDQHYNLTDRSPTRAWKIRLLVPHGQNGPLFQDVNLDGQRDSITTGTSIGEEFNAEMSETDNEEEEEQ